MSKFFYILAILCLLVGLEDFRLRADTEGTVLLLLVPFFGTIGLLVSKATTKVCPRCSERVKKEASKCKHCGSELQDGERTPRPANQQRV